MMKQDSNHSQESQEKEDMYGVSQETIRALEEALETGNSTQAHKLVESLHPADMAVVIEYLPPLLRHDLIEILRSHFDPDILAHLDETVREEVMDQLGSREVAEALTGLDSDDVVAVLEDLDEEHQKEILDSIPKEERVIVEETLTYPEESAARLMQREIVCVPNSWTVEKTIQHLAKAKNLPDKFYDVFITNSKRKLLGGVSLDLLLRQAPSTPLKEIVQTDIKPIPALMDQGEVALLFRKYGLVSAPVVNEDGQIVGMITVDDVVDVIEEEAEKDIMHLSRVTESDFFEPLLSTSYSRIRWLIFALFNTLLAVFVISQFQHTIEKMVALAVLMPISAAMSGNAGMQVVAVTVRALATRELGGANMNRAIWKEINVGLINGIVFGGFMGFIAAFWFSDPGLGIVLGGALIINMIWAAVGGVILPILIDRMGMDPAIGAGPFLTTTTDLLGFATFLGFAHLFLV
jgi:magnesium transporter